jgi:hypothetical protein
MINHPKGDLKRKEMKMNGQLSNARHELHKQCQYHRNENSTTSADCEQKLFHSASVESYIFTIAWQWTVIEIQG